MLIVPMTGKLSWRNPPFITILLILANCFIYFGVQFGDDEKSHEAFTYYLESGLAEIETGRFMEYLKASNRAETIPFAEDEKKDNPRRMAAIYLKMRGDGEFMKKLSNEEIITPKDDVYPKWKELSKKYIGMRSELVTEKFVDAQAELVDVALQAVQRVADADARRRHQQPQVVHADTVIAAQRDNVQFDLFAGIILKAFQIVKQASQRVISELVIAIICVEGIHECAKVD